MLDITLITIGKLKEGHYQAVFTDYEKRLRPYARLKIIELTPVAFDDSNKEKSKVIEGREIEDCLSRNKKSSASVFLLAERGKNFSSPDFAAWLDRTQPITLVVGGALGFSPELYERYPQISLSSLTFPHELARLILIEQIYRAATLIMGKSYHY